jgi:tRNA dimethylallyltransferase
MGLADEFDGTVINADSMQVYKELRILSARPSEADERRIPHRLYGTLPASQPCSVGHWRDMAAQEVASVHAAGRLPVVTGGTGMYIRALMQGLASIPPVPPAIRHEVQDFYDKQGRALALQALADVDPETAARLSFGDRQRVIRALEVQRATDRPLSHWLAEGNQGVLTNVKFQALVLQPSREALYGQIDERFVRMLDQGALDEVHTLLALRLDPKLPAMKAVGVRELAAYLDGKTSLVDATTEAQQASRNYAKRQLTWFRNQIPEAESICAQYSESKIPDIFSFIRQFLLTHPL